MNTPATAAVTAYKFTFSTTNAPPPSDRQARLDANQAIALNVYLDGNVTDGTDVTAQLLATRAGDKLHIVQDSDATRYVHYNVKSAPVDRSGYVQIAVQSYDSGGSLATSQAVTVSIEQQAKAPVYEVYEMESPTQLGDCLGEAPTEVSAFSLAGAWYSAHQQVNPIAQYLVAVYDPTKKMIGFIGRIAAGAPTPME